MSTYQDRAKLIRWETPEEKAERYAEIEKHFGKVKNPVPK